MALSLLLYPRFVKFPPFLTPRLLRLVTPRAQIYEHPEEFADPSRGMIAGVRSPGLVDP